MTPRIGDYIVTERLGPVEIIRAYPLGTYDVRHPETDRYFRVTGLHGADWKAVGRYQPDPGSNFEPVIFEG